MSAQRSLAPHERKHERRSVYRSVKWDHRSREGNDGAVRDLTPEGIFLTPFGKTSEQIREGDTVWVVLELDGERHPLSATVRWRGWSKRHDCTGFGLEFDDDALERAKKLYLAIDQKGLFFVPS